MFESFGFFVSFCPFEADDIGEKFFRELMAQREVLRNAASLGSEANAAIAADAEIIVAGHALQRGRDSGRSDVKLLGEARADRRLFFFEHLPDRFQIIFLGDTGFFAPHESS